MSIQRVRQYQRLETGGDLKSWAEKHISDHAAEASLRIQDFDHTRLGNLHPSMLITDSPTFVGLTLSGLTASKPVFTGAAKALVSTGTLGFDQGGTGLTSLGALNTILGVNAAASALEYKSLAAGTGITVTPTAGVLTIAATGAGFVPTSLTITTTSPLSGGGDLSANRTFSLAGLTTLGTANYVVGSTAAATAWEYKQLIAGTNVTIAHGVGTVTITADIEPGVITAYGGASAPTGWLMCDGTSYLRTDYADLFTAIGILFGAADGTHFNVPDLRERFPRGKGGGDTLGATGGAASVTSGTTTADKPIGTGVNHATADYHTHTVATVPPFQNVNFIIKT